MPRWEQLLLRLLPPPASFRRPRARAAPDPGDSELSHAPRAGRRRLREEMEGVGLRVVRSPPRLPLRRGGRGRPDLGLEADAGSSAARAHASSANPAPQAPPPGGGPAWRSIPAGGPPRGGGPVRRPRHELRRLGRELRQRHLAGTVPVAAHWPAAGPRQLDPAPGRCYWRTMDGAGRRCWRRPSDLEATGGVRRIWSPPPRCLEGVALSPAPSDLGAGSQRVEGGSWGRRRSAEGSPLAFAPPLPAADASSCRRRAVARARRRRI
ncbi:unnamed protein product [Urochloa humidicola]